MCVMCALHIYIYIYTHKQRERERDEGLRQGSAANSGCRSPRSGVAYLCGIFDLGWTLLSLILLLLSLLVSLLLLVVVVVPCGLLGGLWTKCMFFRKEMCSRLGQKQLFKSTSMQQNTF